MTIIRIEPHENGGHDNQTTSAPIPIPEGYAYLPAEVGTPETLPNYPFGDITVETRDGITYVTSWTPLPIPEPEPGPEEPQYTELQLLGQQVTELELLVLGGGVNHV